MNLKKTQEQNWCTDGSETQRNGNNHPDGAFSHYLIYPLIQYAYKASVVSNNSHSG